MSQPDPHVHDLVDDYLHELLDAARSAHVESHCASCPACRAALDEARGRLTALRSLPVVEAGGHLIPATLDRIAADERARKRRRRRIVWGTAAALAASALVLVCLEIYYRNLSASPADLIVLGQRQLLAASPGSLRVRLLDHRNSAPLAGVPVTVELLGRNNPPVELARFTTDARGNGQPRFRLPDWADGDYELRVIAQTRGSPEVITRPVRLRRSWKLMLSSDKPVYQPGQTVHVRALALRRPDLKPVAGQPSVFTLTDPRGNVLFKQQGKTSAFGISAADCPLDREILEGAYTIACKVGDTESRLAVEVKKYVLPKFKIDVRFDQPFYQPGATAHVTVQADYFFGKPVSGGAVEVDVKTESDARLLQYLSARTDAKGSATLNFVVPAKLVGHEQDARLSFQVTLTDSAGQKQTRTTERVVTTRPVRIEAIPEGGTLVEGVVNRVYLLTTRADGSPVSARLTVTGIGDLRTDARGVASFEFTPRTQSVSWTIRATDDRGEILARRHYDLTCGQAQPDFLLRTDRAVYRAGDTMKLTALGTGVEPVFVDFLRDGQTILTETVDVKDGRGDFSFDLPPDLFGTLKLCAYRFDATGIPVSKTRVVYIQPPDQLRVETKLDKPEYRPGGRAHLNLTLTDAKGAPCPGALSLAAVDEAVFSVLQQRPGMEQSFYTLEQELLKPVYAIYPWAPDQSPRRAPETESQDRALFAATARSEDEESRILNDRRHSFVAPSAAHSLGAASFPDKVAEVEHVRTRRTESLRIGWMLLLTAGLVSGFVLLCIYVRPAAMVFGLAWVCAFLLLCAGFLTQFGGCAATKMREAAVGQGEEGLAVVDLARSSLSKSHEKTSSLLVQKQRAIRMGGGGGEPERDTPVHVRELFPETLLWRPQLITDDHGRASLDIDLADSITTWRLGASAVTADGRLGATQAALKVFQPFFVDLDLPVALTRGDEVGVPVVVHNHLDKPQTVTLTLADAPWFTRLGSARQRLDLGAHEVRSLHYRLRVTKVGNHTLQVTARGSGLADAIKRDIEVVPDGRRVEQVLNGTLQQPVSLTLTVPQNAVEGSARAFVKIYPSSFSQLVEGLDNIFRMPSGCFEQTSSTTYPNVLALDYLRTTKKVAPQVEAKARQYIHLGYQRLVGFEVKGGGFDWFGRPPANRTLTAYGLMEFEDMARVHDVDPELIARTRRWLLEQRKADGSWDAEGHALEEDMTRGERLAATAYIAWAVFAHGQARDQASATLDYLLSHRPGQVRDAHTLALVCNALLALDPDGREAAPYLDRLESLKRTKDDGKLAWWETSARTTFYAAGPSANIETTALATLALLGGKRHPATCRTALAWLVSQKDGQGTWYSTQATVLSLKALLAGTGRPLGGDGTRRIEVRVGDQFRQAIVIPADQSEVLRQLDVSKYLAPGPQRITLTETSGTGAGYQVSFRYHVPEDKRPGKAEPLAITLAYDRTELSVNDTVKVTARVVNRTAAPAPMVMLDLPVPAGFAPVADDFAALLGKGSIARFQAQPRRVLVYLRELAPGRPLELTYRLRATMPVKTAAPGAQVYEYYAPDRQAHSPGVRLTVKSAL